LVGYETKGIVIEESLAALEMLQRPDQTYMSLFYPVSAYISVVAVCITAE